MKHKTGGMGFISVLTLILIVLKLTGNLNWIWITCPMWITLSIFIIIMVAGRLKKGHG